ncbi:transmembrane prolyl 4-hydroxylase-like [Montipora foliosa]|uniref:transmembrane prolyl 4-hydroxylase-like n=1 Tax=Montipora foliosa TaxID=591990 RepID=UPI0035F20979
MHMFLTYVVVTFVVTLRQAMLVSCDSQKRQDKSCENGVCFREEDQGPCKPDDDEPRLFRWDPIKIGHTRELKLETGRKFKMITLASKPPLFEIPDFLSGSECKHIINLANTIGLRGSDLHLDNDLDQRKDFLRGHASGRAGDFANWDKNRDGTIRRDEVIDFAESYKFLYLDPMEVDDMIIKLNLTEFDDDYVTLQEFSTLPTAAMDEYLNDIKEKHPAHRERFSQQAWLLQGKTADDVLKRLRKRVAKLTRLSDRIVRGGEPLQVVKYEANGHYNAHYDSQYQANMSHVKCCHLDLSLLPNCRVCRYATILYYLNDVEDGGETAFPVVDKPKFDKKTYIESMSEDKFNLMQYCYDGNLVVAPKRGKAILWYNHFVDEETGWMGEMDEYALHGGCGLWSGVKWIANNWITSADARWAHYKSDHDV